jgi:hypothetical protein
MAGEYRKRRLWFNVVDCYCGSITYTLEATSENSDSVPTSSESSCADEKAASYEADICSPQSPEHQSKPDTWDRAWLCKQLYTEDLVDPLPGWSHTSIIERVCFQSCQMIYHTLTIG